MEITTIETSSGYPTTIARTHSGPRVATQFGADIDTLEARQLRSHYEDALRAIDATYGVWCKNESDRADVDGGEEVWYPRELDEQPTHWLVINGKRVASVLPVGEKCKPEELTDNSGLATRDEWIDGSPTDYSLIDGVLHCNGMLVVGSWSLDAIESE